MNSVEKHINIDAYIARALLSCSGTMAFDPVSVANAMYKVEGKVLPLDEITERFFHLLSPCETHDERERLLSKCVRDASEQSHKRGRKVSSRSEGKSTNAKSHENRMAKSTSGHDSHDPTKEQLLECLNYICTSHLSDIFLQPVDSNIFMSFNQYYEGPYITRIFHPMDLGSIRRMIETGSIHTWCALSENLVLIATNCVFFNAPDSEFPKLGKQFCKFALGAINDFAH